MVSDDIYELTSASPRIYLSSSDQRIDGIDLIVILFERPAFTSAIIEAGGE